MDNVYGEACLPFIRFVIKHRDWVRRQLVAARAKFNPKSDDDNKERFYRDTIVTALVAGKIAEKIGLVSFNVGAMSKWASTQVLKMRESRRESKYKCPRTSSGIYRHATRTTHRYQASWFSQHD